MQASDKSIAIMVSLVAIMQGIIASSAFAQNAPARQPAAVRRRCPQHTAPREPPMVSRT